MFHDLTIISKDTPKSEDDRYNLDKDYYNLGKDYAEQELPRDSVVELTKNKRDIECFNMGYSYGSY